MPATNVIELIGNTPIVQLADFDAGPCELFLKLESQNPGGSIKDRIGLSMISAAEPPVTCATSSRGGMRTGRW